MTDVTICDQGCSSLDGCCGNCGELPPRIAKMPSDEFVDLLAFANVVQKWAWGRPGEPTFGQAARHLGVSVELIADAVCVHYWMFTPDPDLPLAERRIDHDGE